MSIWDVWYRNCIIRNSFHIRIRWYTLCNIHIIHYCANPWSKITSQNVLGPLYVDGGSTFFFAGDGGSTIYDTELVSLFPIRYIFIQYSWAFLLIYWSSLSKVLAFRTTLIFLVIWWNGRNRRWMEWNGRNRRWMELSNKRARRHAKSY